MHGRSLSVSRAALVASLGLGALVAAPSNARADLPPGVRYDDGFAHFAVTERGSIENNQPRSQYYLTAHARLLGPGIAANSAFEFVVKRGANVLGRFTCTGAPAFRAPRRPGTAADSFVAVDCANRELFFTESGPLTVEVNFVDDRTDARTLVRTHTVDVRRLSRMRNATQRDRDDFVVNAHAEAAAMLIETTPAQHPTMYANIRGAGGSEPSQNSVFLFAPRSGAAAPGALTMRCTVDGQPLEMAFARVFANQGTNTSGREYVGTEARLQGTVVQGEYLRFRTDGFMLPLTFGSGDEMIADRVRLEEHPGAWDCSLRREDRSVFRSFRFRVGPNGAVLPHPEEAAGLSLPERVHLVDGSIPADSALDERTDPAATRAGAFYGRAWATAEGRAIGAGIPQRGEAYPPSARAGAANAAGRPAGRR